MNKTVSGILAAFGICVTAAIALPLVNVFLTLTSGELMIIRGGVSALCIAALFPRTLARVSKPVFGFSLLFALANFCLYQGIRAWGANPTIVILTTTPIVNIVAKWYRGQKVDTRVLLSLAVLLIGVSIALNPWDTEPHAAGILWSVTAVLAVGIGFEILGTVKDIDPYYKSFWIAALMIAVGTATTAMSGRIPFTQEVWTAKHALSLLGYGVAGGFLYILANVIAFAKLRTEVASTLAMGETPAVIIGARLTLGETMTWLQWFGVLVAMGALIGLSAAEAKAAKEQEDRMAAPG